VKLQGQPLRLLVLLASRPGELVTHREIHRHLWHDHVVDFTGGTHVCMRQIRAALNEDAGRPRFIETVARHGYRFIAQVQPVAGEVSADAGPEQAPARPRQGPRARIALAGAALLAIVAFVALSIRGGLLPFPGAASAAGTDPRVLELYENAKQLASYEQRDRQVLAHSLLRRALAIDPDHGPTHALIADLITQKGTAILGIEGGRAYDLVEHHLDIAARHGADASDILVTRGRQLLYGERQLGPAFDAMQRAIDANPANPVAWQLISHALYLQGRFDEALAASQRAEELSADPNGVLWDRLQIYYLSERYEELFALYERLDHTQKTGAITIGVALELTGRHAEAFAFIVDALRHRGILIGDTTAADRMIDAGDTAPAYRWLLAEIRKNEAPPLGGRALAVFQTLAGDEPGAARTLREYVRKFERMEQGVHVDCLCYLTIRQDPFLKRLAGWPQVQEALAVLDAAIAAGPEPVLSLPASRSRKL
jgi:DNA-binding winged helix-turn-helix (wHTH) protein/tetratricopeptide (TPR) repeat protein